MNRRVLRKAEEQVLYLSCSLSCALVDDRKIEPVNHARHPFTKPVAQQRLPLDSPRRLDVGSVINQWVAEHRVGSGDSVNSRLTLTVLPALPMTLTKM